MILVDGEPSKFCRDCAMNLPLSAFSRNKRSKDGLSFYCTMCYRARYLASKRKRDGPPRTRLGQGPKNVPPGFKWCPGCDTVFELDRFHRNKTSGSGRVPYCKNCRATRSRADHLQRAYGITESDVEQMLTSQGGLCAICREAPAAHIDHDHTSGRVRAMLCFNCNGALGQFRDRPDLMARAALYLSLGAEALSRHDGLVGALAAPIESARPEREDNAYLFEFLDGLDAA